CIEESHARNRPDETVRGVEYRQRERRLGRFGEQIGEQRVRPHHCRWSLEERVDRGRPRLDCLRHLLGDDVTTQDAVTTRDEQRPDLVLTHQLVCGAWSLLATED